MHQGNLPDSSDCKSKTVASARMLARHQTPHEQLVASVSAETRNAYLTLINGG